MDITKDNFSKSLPLIRESIHSADFIAFDTEFSGSRVSLTRLLGLSVGFADRQHEYDTVEDRYQKLKHNCTRMNTFQVGLCTFHWDDSVKKYVCRPFNFYVFPDSQVFESSIVQFQVRIVMFMHLCVGKRHKVFGF